jgi:hypothetical protein
VRLALLLALAACTSAGTLPIEETWPSVKLQPGYKAFPYPAHCTPHPMRTDTVWINGHKVPGPFVSFLMDCDGRVKAALADTAGKWYGPVRPGGSGW